MLLQLGQSQALYQSSVGPVTSSLSVLIPYPPSEQLCQAVSQTCSVTAQIANPFRLISLTWLHKAWPEHQACYMVRCYSAVTLCFMGAAGFGLFGATASV